MDSFPEDPMQCMFEVVPMLRYSAQKVKHCLSTSPGPQEVSEHLSPSLLSHTLQGHPVRHGTQLLNLLAPPPSPFRNWTSS